MELEDINYFIGNANKSKVTSLNLLFKGLTFLSPYKFYGQKNLKGFDISSSQLASLPPKISDFKSFTIFDNNNYSGKMVK